MSEYVDENFLDYVLKNLLDDPEEMVITRKVDEYGTLFEVKVSEQDMGKLIGKGGQTVKALRVLLRVIAAKLQSRINLKILEPGKL